MINLVHYFVLFILILTGIADPPVCSGGGPGSDAGLLDEFLSEVNIEQ